VNRRLALFRLAALPGALAAVTARAQQTVEMPTVPFVEPKVNLTVTPTLESLGANGNGSANGGGNTGISSPQPEAAPLRRGVDELLFKALSLVGVRYRPGGNSPETGFDCSGYVCYLYREVYSMVLPRTSDAMAAVQRGENIPRSALQPGDLVFFNTMRRPYTHVGIYLGEDRMIHAPSSGGMVRVESLNERYWVKRWNGARRIAA
jgi:cell wall-associated NlpC family hydrolase